ncbi:MAG: phosphonate ABC transporter, permease protein PhnE [Hyphomicrobiales bacterium]|nr:phosphonate ABC transporter, permease protein PhnE [Hyphomicrobiales bacterium]
MSEQRIFGDAFTHRAVVARHPQFFQSIWTGKKKALTVFFLALGLYLFGWYSLGASFGQLWGGMGKFGWIVGLMLPPDPGSLHLAWVFFHGLIETLSMAFLGTLVAACLAFPFGLLAAKNVIPNPLIHVFIRRFLDTIRGIDTLIWALIWIGVVGLGPFAGVLAIITSDFGSFGKLFSEAIEAADKKPIEGVQASGGSKLHALRFGIIPQIFPIIASQVLYYFESNTRSATIIGIVGAGGIGLYLTETIRTLEWQQTSFIIVLVLVTVSIIDWISGKLRLAFIGQQAR